MSLHPISLHQALDALVAAYLVEHPDRLPSTTTVMELIEWSAEQAKKSDGERCTGCGHFLSAIRVEMRIDRCAKCEGKRRRRG